MLREVAANIKGKPYESKTSCGWTAGSGGNRRVWGGTGGGGGVGVDSVLDVDVHSIPHDNGQAPPSPMYSVFSNL